MFGKSLSVKDSSISPSIVFGVSINSWSKQLPFEIHHSKKERKEKRNRERKSGDREKQRRKKGILPSFHQKVFKALTLWFWFELALCLKLIKHDKSLFKGLFYWDLILLEGLMSFGMLLDWNWYKGWWKN